MRIKLVIRDFKKTIVLLLCFVICNSSLLFATAEDDLTKSMLVLLTKETNGIINSSENRVVLDDTYYRILDNYDPSVIDYGTQDYLTLFLDCIRDLRLVDTKRQRIKYLSDLKNKKAIYSAIPGAISTIGMAALSGNPTQLALAVAGTAMSSVGNFFNAKSQVEMDDLLENWNLDDEEFKLISSLEIDFFNHIIDITNENNLIKTDSFSQESVTKFNKLKNSINKKIYDISIVNKGKVLTEDIEKLKIYSEQYKNYIYYWQLLATAYYWNHDYEHCLEAIDEYEKLYVPLFRKDSDYALMMMKKIEVLMSLGKYDVSEIESLLEIIIDNSKVENWENNWFCILEYVKLGDEKNNSSSLNYYESAKKLLNMNIKVLNDEYINNLREYENCDFINNAISEIDNEIKDKNYEIGEIENYRDVSKTLKKLNKEKIKALKNDIKTLEKRRKLVDKRIYEELPPTSKMLIANFQLYEYVLQQLGQLDSLEYKTNYGLLCDSIFTFEEQSYLLPKNGFDNSLKVSLKDVFHSISKDPAYLLSIEIPLSLYMSSDFDNTIANDNFKNYSLLVNGKSYNLDKYNMVDGKKVIRTDDIHDYKVELMINTKDCIEFNYFMALGKNYNIALEINRDKLGKQIISCDVDSRLFNKSLKNKSKDSSKSILKFTTETVPNYTFNTVDRCINYFSSNK